MVSETLGVMPVIRVPAGKLPLVIVIPTEKPEVSPIAMVVRFAVVIVRPPRETRGEAFRLSVPALTKVPPV